VDGGEVCFPVSRGGWGVSLCVEGGRVAGLIGHVESCQSRVGGGVKRGAVCLIGQV
jgi:hypothetical protein